VRNLLDIVRLGHEVQAYDCLMPPRILPLDLVSAVALRSGEKDTGFPAAAALFIEKDSNRILLRPSLSGRRQLLQLHVVHDPRIE
jgi:hypothetical protein